MIFELDEMGKELLVTAIDLALGVWEMTYEEEAMLGHLYEVFSQDGVLEINGGEIEEAN